MASLKLQGGEIAFIDDEDMELVAQFCDYWYARPIYRDHHLHIPICTIPEHNHIEVVASNKKQTRLHRLITGFDNIYHIDYDGLNNKKENLELSGAVQTAISSPKKVYRGKNITSNYKGVSWNKNMGKWKATISHNRQITNLGYYTSELKAAKAYDKAAKELFGEYACPNFTE
jgi:AP2 domain.